MTTYLRSFFSVVSLLFLMLLSFNWLVDPLWIFRSTGYPNLNLVKPEFKKHLRLIKAHHVREVRPLAFALGTSAAEHMFDMSNPLWGVSPDRRYNLGLAGSNMYEQLKYFEHAVGIQKPEIVIFALDFESFRIRKQPKPDFDAMRLSGINSGFLETFYSIKDISNALLSFQFFKKSLKTLSSQGSSINQYERSGQRNPMFHLDQYNDIGFEALAEKSMTSLMSKRFEFEAAECNDCTTLTYLRRVLAICRQNRIGLKLVINPYHDWFFSTLLLSGNWIYYDRWLRAIVEEVSREAEQAGDQPFDLFSFNPLTLENGVRLSNARMQDAKVPYFWDLVHASTEIGNPMLATLFDSHLPEQDALRHLNLNRATISLHLQRLLDGARRSLKGMNPEELLLIQQVKSATTLAREKNTIKSARALRLIRDKRKLVLSEGLYDARARGLPP